MQFSKTQKALALAVIVIGGIFFGSYFGYDAGYERGARDQINANVANAGKNAPEEIDFAPFWAAWNILEERFVSATSTEKTTAQEKLWGAIGGLTDSLGDPYTVFLPPEEKKIFESDISGNFEGVGMEIGKKDDILIVVAPLKGTPAEKAGLRSGDKIIQIDKTLTNDLSVDGAVRLIRGKRGTTVKLTILREGNGGPMDISVTRDVINIPTIETPTSGNRTGEASQSDKYKKLLDEKGVFVIRLYNFYSPSPGAFRQSLREFVESGANKLIIDLRGNPGGFLEASVDIASWFLPQGKTVVRENFGEGKGERLYRSKGYNIFGENSKFVILVDGGSASASEILAGALREHGKAVLVGAQTFGKGSVQELVPLTEDTSLKVTVAQWLTPQGMSISEGGLKPDYEVKITQEDLSAGRDPQLEKAVELINSL